MSSSGVVNDRYVYINVDTNSWPKGIVIRPGRSEQQNVNRINSKFRRIFALNKGLLIGLKILSNKE